MLLFGELRFWNWKSFSMPKRYSLHMHPLTLNIEPSPSVLGGIADEAGDGARQALSSPCPAARRPLSPSSSSSNDQRRRSLHEHVPPWASSIFLPSGPPTCRSGRRRRPWGERGAMPPLPYLPPRRAPHRPSAGKPRGSSSSSLGAPPLPPSVARCHGVDIQT